MNRELIYSTLFNKLSTLRNLTATENYTIPATPYQIYPLWYTRYVSSVSVVNSNNNTPFTKVSSNPAAGQFTVDAQGLYTFNSADSATPIMITYLYQGIVFAGRSLLHWNDVSPAMMPALFLVQKEEDPEQKRGVPPKWTLDVNVYIYVNSPNDPDFVPAKLINPLLDEVETMLAFDNPDKSACTLGGLVSHCWISSKVMTAEGQISDGEVVLIPISILVPT